MPSIKLYLTTIGLVSCCIFQGCTSGTAEIVTSAPLVEEKQIPPETPKISVPFKFSQKMPAEGLEDKILEFVKKFYNSQSKSGPKFFLSAIVSDKYLGLGAILKDFYNKKYSDSEIKNAYYKEVKKIMDNGKILLNINISWIGGYDDNTSEITFYDNSYEFFFLENEKGDYVKAASAELLDPSSRVVNFVNYNVPLNISFPEAEVQTMMQDSKQLFLTFKGLKIMPKEQDNRIELKYPFAEYYKKDFSELIKMVQEMEDYGQ